MLPSTIVRKTLTTFLKYKLCSWSLDLFKILNANTKIIKSIDNRPGNRHFGLFVGWYAQNREAKPFRLIKSDKQMLNSITTIIIWYFPSLLSPNGPGPGPALGSYCPQQLDKTPNILYENPKILYENPKTSYENPKISYENPKIWYENPTYQTKDPTYYTKTHTY